MLFCSALALDSLQNSMLPNVNMSMFNSLAYPFIGWIEICYSWMNVYFIELFFNA